MPSSKPDLTGYAPELREALIKRRNYWRAQRGQAVEMWDSVTERLVDRDEHIVREAVTRTVQALTSQSKPTGPEIAAVAESTAVSPVPEPPVKPYHEMRLEEFQAAAATQFAGIFDRQRRSPFWAAALVDQQAEDGTQ